MAKVVETTSLNYFNHGNNTWRTRQVNPSGLYSLLALAPQYIGAFIPEPGSHGAWDGSYTQYTQRLALSSANGRLFVTGRSQGTGGVRWAGEFQIPNLSSSLNINDLPLGLNTQDYRSVDAAASDISNPIISGMLEVNGELILCAFEHYDANGSETKNVYVFSDARNIANTVKGAFAVDGGARAGGYILPIPAAYQASFGGRTHFIGGGVGMAIADRASMGPNFYAVNAQDILDASTPGESIAAAICSNYPHGDGTMLIGNETQQSGDANVSLITQLTTSNIWNVLTRVGGVIHIPGTRTLMVLGHSWDGRGTVGYKITNETGYTYPGYGPSLSDAYMNAYWLFDINDLIDAFNGTIQPHEVYPYEYGQFPFFPYSTPGKRITGACYDEASDRLYVSLGYGASGRYNNGTPVIAALSLGI